VQLNRVVITGMGAISPYGSGVAELLSGLYQNRSAVRYCPEMLAIKGLRSLVAASVPDSVLEMAVQQIARKHRRSMSSMSIYAVLAAAEAMHQAGVGAIECESGQLGVILGSTLASSATTEEFFNDFARDHSLERMKTSLFFKIMNHSCAANIAQTFSIKGRILAPAAACATGSQSIGYGYEMIATGQQEMLLCGGADEHHPLTSATFDVMHAASTAYNDDAQHTPRPFSAQRDGMVCGEGSGVLLLESLSSALQRGANILGEVVGFATLTDSGNIANPDSAIMAECMQLALDNAHLTADQIGYVNAHATATEQGDIAESNAIAAVFGDKTPVSSLKGHLGHTLAASGALEAIATLDMQRSGKIVPTLHLTEIDSRCAPLNYVREADSDVDINEHRPIDFALKNSFALGGVNTSLVLGRYISD